MGRSPYGYDFRPARSWNLSATPPRPRSAGSRQLSGAAGHGEAVERILDFARRQLEMDLAWMSEFVGGRQLFQRVSAEPDGAGPKAGTSRPLVDSYCTRVLDGRLKSLIPNARRDLSSRDLSITDEFDIGAYIAAPIYRADGQLHGMLCCISHTPRTELGERHAAIMALLAQMLGDLTDRSSLVRRQRSRPARADRRRHCRPRQASGAAADRRHPTRNGHRRGSSEPVRLPTAARRMVR